MTLRTALPPCGGAALRGCLLPSAQHSLAGWERVSPHSSRVGRLKDRVDARVLRIVPLNDSSALYYSTRGDQHAIGQFHPA